MLDRLGVTKAHHRIDEYGGMWYEGKMSLLSKYLSKRNITVRTDSKK